MTDASTRHAATAVFVTPDGAHAPVDAGHFIGRSVGAALRLRDPGISEAHALVSLRGGSLHLLALRGRFRLGNALLTDLELEEGQVIVLSSESHLTVAEVLLPTHVLGLSGDGLPRQIVPPVAALDARAPRLSAHLTPDADALLWCDGEDFILRRPGHADLPAQPGVSFVLEGRRFRFEAVPLEDSATVETQLERSFSAPLELCARYDSVHLTQGAFSAHVVGIPARLLSELVAVRAPVAWEALARDLWPDESDGVALRQKWDRTLARLRQRLRAQGVRSDLVQADGLGRVELVLAPGDITHDES